MDPQGASLPLVSIPSCAIHWQQGKSSPLHSLVSLQFSSCFSHLEIPPPSFVLSVACELGVGFFRTFPPLSVLGQCAGVWLLWGIFPTRSEPFCTFPGGPESLKLLASLPSWLECHMCLDTAGGEKAQESFPLWASVSFLPLSEQFS